MAHDSAGRNIRQTLLKERGFRVTPGREKLLQELEKTALPKAASYFEKKMSPYFDRVSVYRALEAFVQAGLARRVDLGHAHMHYEKASLSEHHHHLVCTRCGTIEDIVIDGKFRLEKKASEASKKFSVITSHSMEFFGLCKQCV